MEVRIQFRWSQIKSRKMEEKKEAHLSKHCYPCPVNVWKLHHVTGKTHTCYMRRNQELDINKY